MNPHIWLNKGFSSMHGFAEAIRERDPAFHVSLSHVDDRPEITSLSFFKMPREPEVANQSDYVTFTLETIQGSKSTLAPITALLATRHRQAISENRAALEELGVRVCVGSTDPALLKACENKSKFTHMMKSAGLPVPETIQVVTEHEARNAIREIENKGYESCIKPAVGVYGAGYWKFSHILDDFTHFQNPDCREISPEFYLQAFGKRSDDHAHLVMEFLPGHETSVDIVCKDGVIHSHACRTKIDKFRWIKTGGEEYEIAKHVAQVMQLDGLVNVQLKKDQEGKNKILEVNTRPAGGFTMSNLCGINLAYDCALMMHDKPVQPREIKEAMCVAPVDAYRRVIH